MAALQATMTEAATAVVVETMTTVVAGAEDRKIAIGTIGADS